MKKFFPLLLIIFVLHSSVYFLFYKSVDKKYSSYDTIPILNKNKVSRGYTLITPTDTEGNQNPQNSLETKIYLVDLLGRPVHTWKTKKQTWYSVLRPNGNLLVAITAQAFKSDTAGGTSGILQELDWNSNVLWEYKNLNLHHDIFSLPNGNVLITLWEKTPPEIAARARGGLPDTEGDAMLSDEIAELDKNGKKVWSWHSYEHFDPALDTINDYLRRRWTHLNGLGYTEKNPIDGTAAVVASARVTDTVYIIRKSDGKILWRSPKGMLSKQHDPSFLPNGNILVFDNRPNPRPYSSRAVEINPKTNKIVWQFEGGEKHKFFATHVSGAQRLSNGNTLITDGPKGHVFEVTKDGEVVWDFNNPYRLQNSGYFPSNFLFKAKRYGENEVKWPNKLPSSINFFEIDLYNLLSKIYP